MFAAAVRFVWSLIAGRSRQYDVSVTSQNKKLIAGVRSHLCTIQVQTGEDEDWDGRQESLPTLMCNPRVLGTRVYIAKWCKGDNGKPEKKVFVEAEKASENRDIVFYFPDVDSILSITYDGNYSNSSSFTCFFSVSPSDPKSAELGSITSDHGQGYYRGGTTTMCVQTFDQFGNPAGGPTLRDAITISSVVPSDSVSHSPTRVSWEETGIYTVEVKCLKVGKTNLQLEVNFGEHGSQTLNVELVIFPPPLSPEYSQIVLDQEQNCAYEAGTEVRFNISLRDIYDNPIQEEKKAFVFSDVEICISLTDKNDDHTSEKYFLLNSRRTFLSANTFYDDGYHDGNERSQMESVSAEATESDGLFQISFTLFVAGEKELDVQMMSQSIVDEPIPITVCASSPERITTLGNTEYLESEALTTNENDMNDTAQENVWQILQFTLEDNFGNTVPLQATNLEIALVNGQGEDVTSSLEINDFQSVKNKEIRLKYRIKMQGQFKLKLLARSRSPQLVGAMQEGQEAGATTLELLHLRVVAPISPKDSKFYVLHEFKDVEKVPAIFVEDVINCKLEMCDEKGNKYHGPFRLQKLKVYLNGEKKELRNEKKSNGEYLFDLIYGKSEKKELKVTLNDEKIAHQCPDKFLIFGIGCYDDRNYNFTCYEEIDSVIISVQGVRRGDIIGSDQSRLNNINRALDAGEEEGRLRSRAVNETANGVEIVTEDIVSHEGVQVIRGLILSHLRAQHYRNKANEFDKNRREWQEKSQKAYNENKKEQAGRYSEIKTQFGNLMSRSNLLARDTIFEMYNKNRPPLEEIDLHELLVADEGKLRKYEKQLQKKRSANECKQLVEKARREQDEAIEKLRERLEQIENATEKPPWLEIIVGAGHHSEGAQKIEPKVRRFLQQQTEEGRLPEAEDLNEGSILITFKEYTGPEPCFGYFYCETCKKSWCSPFSWIGKYQCCYRCHKKGRRSECYPKKQSERRRGRYRRRNTDSQSNIPHHRDLQELCQKCQELGEYCMSF